MVAHRLDFLAAGHFQPVVDALASRVGAVEAAGLLLDIGGGPGWYSARVLEACPDRYGVTFDTSTAAARRAAKAHPRLASVVADGWDRYPVADGCVAIALCLFAPRNATEIVRVLAPGGELWVVTPAPGHLAQAREALGLLGVGTGKEEKLDAAFTDLVCLGRESISHDMHLSPADLIHLASMGPSAFHLDAADLRERVAKLPDPFSVSCDLVLSRYRHSTSEAGHQRLVAEGAARRENDR